MPDKKISDEELIEERAKGKSLAKIAREYGYKEGNETTLQRRLEELGIKMNLNRKNWVKLMEMPSKIKGVPLPKYIQKETGLEPEKNYKVNRVPMPNKKQILLRFKEDEDNE